jgi:hypothetical protein
VSLVLGYSYSYKCDDYVDAGGQESELDKLRREVTDILSGIEPKEALESIPY